MSLSVIETLQQALAAFDQASPANQKAAATLAAKFAKRIEVQTSGDQTTQYQACAIAAGRRLPSDIEFLKTYAEYSQYTSVREMCRQEIDPATSLFNTNRRLGMPEGTVVR